MKRIIYTNKEGGVSVIIPSAEALQSMTIEQIALKDVPSGLMYQIVDESEILTDRTFRGAWVLDNGIKEDNAKAVEIAKDKIRAWRKKQFEENDIILQNSIVDGDEVKKSEAVARRDYLRDLPEQCDGKTVQELKDIVKNLDR